MKKEKCIFTIVGNREPFPVRNMAEFENQTDINNANKMPYQLLLNFNTLLFFLPALFPSQLRRSLSIKDYLLENNKDTVGRILSTLVSYFVIGRLPEVNSRPSRFFRF